MKPPPQPRLLSLLLLAATLSAPAQEWTRFRGPNGSGISHARTIPTVWTPKDITWRAELPGTGHSSPVVWGDRVLLMSGEEKSNRVSVLCLGTARGDLVWRRDFPVAPYHRNNFNTLASGSPAVDQDRVYTAWSDAERMVARTFDHAGKLLWERDLGPFASQHGGACSPVLWHDLVIISKEHDGESFITALDAATGAPRWKAPRHQTPTTYATPFLYEPDAGPPALVFAGQGHGFSALSPADGTTLWELPGVFDKRVVGSPILADGLLIASCGSGEGGNYLVAARPGDTRQGTHPAVAYKITRSSPYVPTSVCAEGRLFLWADDGTVSCLRPATGEVVWQQRLGKHFFSSPVWVDGRVFCASTTGDVLVIRAGDRFELLATNPLGETVHSTPAVAGGRMFIHTTKHLVCVTSEPPAP